jgi:hypothetical protein
VNSSIYLSTQGYKNKKESREISTIYGERLGHLPSSVKVNTPLSLVLNSGNSDLTAIRLAPGVRNFSTKLSVNNSEISEEFLSWFSGFTDGEGNFSIMLDRTYIRFRFKISLHIDDLEVLNVIKSNLNIGKIIVEEKRNSCAFVVQSFSELKDVLCPIFTNFPLHTSKKLDFQDFYTAILIRAKSKNENLSDSDKEKILSIKEGMNLGRTVFKYDFAGPQIIINPNLFIGFIEAEGTFGIKTESSLYFQVAQKITSHDCLDAIKTFLTGLYNSEIPKNSDIQPVNVTSATNIRTNVISIVISNVDALYYHILPWLDHSKFYSRKHVDFKLWKIALLLKINGYYYLTEGKNLFLDISDVLNKRYSTDNKLLVDINKAIENIYDRFYKLSQIEPPFNVKLFNSHVDNARKFRLANKSDQPRTVYIYTSEGLIEGSPFASFSLAHFISKIKKKIPDPYYKLGIYTCKINISMNITSRQ